MAMDLNAKAAYIRGLMTGMDFDADSKNGKVIAAMMDLLEEMAAQVTEHDDAWIRSTTSWRRWIRMLTISSATSMPMTTTRMRTTKTTTAPCTR